MTLAWLTHPLCDEHETGPGHPERPARLAAIRAHVEQTGMHARLQFVEAPEATREQLVRVHHAAYVDRLLGAVPVEGLRRLDPDTVMGPHSLRAALHAAGALVHAVDLVMAGDATTAFCAVRPPGHHAERGRAMGFCLFGNVAVGAAHALQAHGLERIAIVDFDVHHGNGTQDLLADEPRVLFCSSFQHPFYPYSGADTVSDHIMNLPLPAGTDGRAYREAVAARWLPALDAFRPELVMFSAGFDAHRDDPLANLRLVEDDFAWITREVVQIAKRHAGGRVVSTLEGGYDLDALGRSVVAHVEALLTT